MKNREYRLEQVEQIRKKYRDDAAIVVKKCRGELDFSRLKLDQVTDELKRKQKEVEIHLSELNKESASIVSVGQIVTRKEHLELLRNQERSIFALVKKQTIEVAEKEALVERARKTLEERVIELRSIELHKERWKNSLRKEDKRMAQKKLDEFVSADFSRRKQKE